MLFYVQVSGGTIPSQPTVRYDILTPVVGIGTSILLTIPGIPVVWLCLRKWKRKKSSEATDEPPTPLTAIYEDPDALLAHNAQLSVHQSIDVTTADNVAYSPSIDQNINITTADNFAYFPCVHQDINITTTENIAYSAKIQVHQDEEDDEVTNSS